MVKTRGAGKRKRADAGPSKGAKGSTSRPTATPEPPPHDQPQNFDEEGEQEAPPAMNEYLALSFPLPREPNVEETQGIEPVPPEKFHFQPEDYVVTCKLSSKCDDINILPEIAKKLEDDELEYFLRHPQFKHVWHMAREENHRLTHLWMMLLRTVDHKQGKMAWFVVNGVPIRYSIREHALLTGMNCKAYPPEHTETVGSERFALKMFKKTGKGKKKKDKITVQMVYNKFISMRKCVDRLKLALLLFLCCVMNKSKTHNYLDCFLVQAVDDLEACNTFPWGRYTFDQQLSTIWKTVDHFSRKEIGSWTFNGFIYPLEILMCEAIPSMGLKYRVPYEAEIDGVTAECPRMCKTKWKHCPAKGWTLESVNKALGEIKEIQSILQPRPEEVPLLEEIMDDEDVYEGEDELSINWNYCLLEAKKKIFFEYLFKLDVDGRNDNLNAQRTLSLKETMKKMLGEMNDKFTEKFFEIHEKIAEIQANHSRTEASVKELMEWRRKQDPKEAASQNVEGGSKDSESVSKEEGVEAPDFLENPPDVESGEEEETEEGEETGEEEDKNEEEVEEEEEDKTDTEVEPVVEDTPMVDVVAEKANKVDLPGSSKKKKNSSKKKKRVVRVPTRLNL